MVYFEAEPTQTDSPESSDVGTSWDDTWGSDVSSGDTGDTEDNG